MGVNGLMRLEVSLKGADIVATFYKVRHKKKRQDFHIWKDVNCMRRAISQRDMDAVYRMTDNEIVKDLECCNSNFAECPKECPMYTTKFSEKTNCIDENNGIMALALDLINRQNAAIESLNNQERILICQLAEEREKAIKEFVKRFEKKIKDVKFTIGQTWEIQCALKQTLQKLSEEAENALKERERG